jgi:hypothetical protein
MGISLSVKIGASIDGLLTALKKTEKELNAFSRKATRAGEDLTKGLTLPLVGFGVLAVKNFAEAEKAAASLSAQLRANGKDVQVVMGDYTRFAEEMQNMTTVEDDAVIGFLALAEGMRAPDAKQAVKDAIGLNKAFGVEMPAAIKMAVQAQNGQYTALGKLNPAIKAAETQSQKASIAQQMFASSFTIATEQAKVGLGPMQQLTNQIGNATEKFGALIAEGLLPIVGALKSVMEWTNGLNDTTRKWVVGIGLAVAALGPLLFVVGKIPGLMASTIAGLTAFGGAMKTAWMFAAANPWLLLASAITAATVALAGYFNAKNGKEFEDVQARQKKRIDDQKKATEEYVAADEVGRKKIIEGLKVQAQSYVDLWNKAKAAGDTAGMEHYKVAVAEINIQVDEMKKAVNSSAKAFDYEGAAVKEVNDELEAHIKYMKTLGEPMVGPVNQTFQQAGQGTAPIRMTPVGLGPATPAAPSQEKQKALATATKDIRGEFEAIGYVLDKISSQNLGNFFNSFKNAFSTLADVIGSWSTKTKEGIVNSITGIASAISSVVSGITEIFLQSDQQKIESEDAWYQNKKNNIENSMLGEQEKNAALERLEAQHEKKRKELMLKQAKDQKAAATIQAVIAGALAVIQALASTGPPANFILAAIVGALAGIQVAMIASQPLPALAEGGLATAPTMAMVGDNPNANVDPEVIAPLSKLKNYMKTATDVVVRGVLRGSDIFLSSEMGGTQVQRVRGS